MATMNVKDAAGSVTAVEKPNANGRAAAAASRPVALSTEDLAQIAAIVTKLADVGLSSATLAALESITATVSGTVEIGATSLAALETIELGATTLAALESITVAGTVEIGATSLAALETTELGATSLAALESISATVTGVATEAKQDAQTAAIATIGTRAYGAGQQVAIGASSAASTGLAATEVLLHASSRCFVRVATAATAGAGIPLEAGEKFHLRLTSGQQIHVIRDTADGTLNIVPVA